MSKPSIKTCPRCGQGLAERLTSCNVCSLDFQASEDDALPPEEEAKEVEKTIQDIGDVQSKVLMSVVIGVFFCPVLIYGMFKITDFHPYKKPILDKSLEERYVSAAKSFNKISTILGVIFALWIGVIVITVLNCI